MARDKKPTREEIELFRRSIGPVRKLGTDKAAPVHYPRIPWPRIRQVAEDQGMEARFSDSFPGADVNADEVLFFSRPGLQQRLVQRLRRGQLRIGDELDLHGMTSQMAQKAIARFLLQSQARHIRCVRIIHGKGYGSGSTTPVLKNRVNNWLRQHQGVLAFSSARRDDGGTGAVYVLLRSTSKGTGER